MMLLSTTLSTVLMMIVTVGVIVFEIFVIRRLIMAICTVIEAKKDGIVTSDEKQEIVFQSILFLTGIVIACLLVSVILMV